MSNQNLWAPWRMDYIARLDAGGQPGAGHKPGVKHCFLCAAAHAQSDAERQELLVLRQASHAVLLLNRYPYANGHLLVAPNDHAADLADLSPDVRAEVMELTTLGSRLLRRAMNAQGVNIGMNIGRCAGAGVPGHCHMHVVPRWSGDVNFIQVAGGVRVIPQAMDKSYELLVRTLAELD